MNSLLGYGNGSDDDLDESPKNGQMDPYSCPRPYKKPMGTTNPQDDTNYDEVQMSLSEDSDSESKSQQKYGRDRTEGSRYAPKSRSSRDDQGKDRRDDRKDDKEKSNWPSERNEDRSRYRDKDEARSDRPRPREEERPRYKDGKEDERQKREEDRTRDRGDRFRDEDRVRDRRDERREGSREKYDRYRKDRDRRRSRSPRDGRDRKRSRSPRRGDRSRSRSKERGAGRGRGGGGFQRRFDRGGLNRTDRTGKTGPETKVDEPNAGAIEDPSKARFFMPGITGRFRDQIEKRKLLWQKKEPESKPEAVAVPVAAAGGSRTTKVWEATTFAQDTDGKVANKFKRLMGIRGAGEGNTGAVEVLKKQEEMFSSMEQQYEVARTATHTMRGVGLGFGSYPR